MAYSINFTESVLSNPLKQPIVVHDQTLNSQTSLTFVGKLYGNYPTHVGGDLLHLLENFANSTSPVNPVQGQLWYDNVTAQLMVNVDGTETNWTAASSVRKSVTKPTTASIGDIWVDTINQQLYIYTGVGGNWTLIGPTYSQSSQTGQVIETIVDSSNAPHGIISLYSNNTRIAVISGDKFTPKKTIAGFATVQQGITLINSDNQLYPGQTQSSYRFYGTATNSDSLGGVSSSTYLRSDQNVTINGGSLSVNSVNMGNDSNLHINTDPGSLSNYLISSSSSGNTIEFRLNSNTAAFFASSGNVGIGKKTPTTALDVNGTITGSSGLVITGTSDTATQLSGGISIDKNASIGGDLTISNGTIFVGNSTTHAILSPVLTNFCDIGTPASIFRNIHVQNTIGNVTGNVTGELVGNVLGNVSGTAGSLETTTSFSLIGDVTSDIKPYNGINSSIEFNTILTEDMIGLKPSLGDSIPTDQLLIYRPLGKQNASFIGYITGTTLTVTSVVSGTITTGTTITGMGVLSGTMVLSGSGTTWTVNNSQTTGSMVSPVTMIGTSVLFKTTRDTFLTKVPIVLVGTIILYPSNTLPAGYILCDGQHYPITQYPGLFSVLGPSSLVGSSTYAVPQLNSIAIAVDYIIFTGVL
jgi:hypothetical protein